MADVDQAASLIEYGRLSSHPPDGCCKSFLTVKLTAAVRSLFQARHLASAGTLEAVVAWYLVPLPASTEALTRERSLLMQKGASMAIANGASLRACVQSLRLPPQSEVTFQEEIRGLLVAICMCVGFVPAEHLRMHHELQAMGARIEDLEICFSLQEELQRDMRHQAPAHQIFLCVIWSCHHIIEAGDKIGESRALQLLVQAHARYGNDENLKAVLEKFAEYCSSGGDPNSYAGGREHPPAANSTVERTGITTLFETELQVDARPSAANSNFDSTGITTLFEDGVQVNEHP